MGKSPPTGPEFPWPPPRASARVVINSEFLKGRADEVITLGDVERKLYTALDTCRYFERSYYTVPDGFALVTRLEQINLDGTSKEIPDRWSTEIGPLRKFSLKAYLKALFTARVGYYRIIVFIVAPHEIVYADKPLSDEEAKKLPTDGSDRLPDAIRKLEFSEKNGKMYACTALIYEFEKLESKEASPKIPGRLQGRTHLEKANIWKVLAEE